MKGLVNSSPYFSIKKKILSIDIGIINLGYVFAEVGESIKVIECNRVNITHMRHNKIERCNCQLHHDFCIPDYLDHFIQENEHLFEECDIILIERQPIMGLMNVQDLLFSRFREKVKLISPNKIHKYFGMTKGAYELRKMESESIAKQYLELFTTFETNERKHDMADAMLMIVYYFQTLPKIKKKVNVGIDGLDFEMFRFVPPTMIY
jgi:hypothetical protein